jgi:hypothetical protein
MWKERKRLEDAGKWTQEKEKEFFDKSILLTYDVQAKKDAINKQFNEGELAKVNAYAKTKLKSALENANKEADAILASDKTTEEQKLKAREDLEKKLLAIQIASLQEQIKNAKDAGLMTADLEKELVEKQKDLYAQDAKNWGDAWLEKHKTQLEQLDAIFKATQSVLTAMQDFQKLKNQEDYEALKKSSEDEIASLTANAEAALALEGTTDEQKKKIKDDYNKAVAQAEYKRALGEYELAKAAFDNGKKLQIASAIISTIQGAVQAFTSLAGIPVVGPVLGGIAAAAALAAGYAQVALIEKTTYSGTPPKDPSAALNQSDSGGSGGSGSKFAEGGLLTGRKHSEGGIPTPFGQLEGGEYVVNRSATEAFLPLLDKINGMGKGSGAPNNLSVVGEQTISQPMPIIKTYVVASDMSSQQEANKRLNDIARL